MDLNSSEAEMSPLGRMSLTLITLEKAELLPYNSNVESILGQLLKLRIIHVYSRLTPL